MSPIDLLTRLVDQIERCRPIDDHGHDFQMNQAFIEAKVAVRMATPRIRKRIAMEEGCPTCAELARGSFGPPHDPSPRCESGKRPHCTCDVCF